MPIPPFISPVKFSEAISYLKRKLNRPTFLSASQIASSWDADTKRRAFFSAKVASADVLSVLHKRVTQVMSGDMTDEQARELLRVYLSGEGKDLLASMGFSPPSVGAGIAELGSVRRLRLILYQNTKMATEVGHYRQWAENAHVYPYGRWHLGISEEHREEHVARDGVVYPFDNPVWTEDPPGARYNCHCWREELTAEEAEGFAIEHNTYFGSPSPLEFDPSKSLDDPPPEKDGWPIEIRDQVRRAIANAG